VVKPKKINTAEFFQDTVKKHPPPQNINIYRYSTAKMGVTQMGIINRGDL
jgi:hypothetical protein